LVEFLYVVFDIRDRTYSRQTQRQTHTHTHTHTQLAICLSAAIIYNFYR